MLCSLPPLKAIQLGQKGGQFSGVVMCGWALESDCLGSNPGGTTTVLRPGEVTVSVSVFRRVWFTPSFNL